MLRRRSSDRSLLPAGGSFTYDQRVGDGTGGGPRTAQGQRLRKSILSMTAEVAMLERTMKRLVLGIGRAFCSWRLALALAMSLSFVQGSVMAAEMAVAADDAHHGPSGCNGCGGGDHNDMNAGTCLAVCGPAAQGLMPGESVDAAISFSNRLSGRSTAPKRPVPQSRSRSSQDPHPWLTPDPFRRQPARPGFRWRLERTSTSRASTLGIAWCCPKR